MDADFYGGGAISGIKGVKNGPFFSEIVSETVVGRSIFDGGPGPSKGISVGVSTTMILKYASPIGDFQDRRLILIWEGSRRRQGFKFWGPFPFV